jgi:dihydrofolate reductase
MGRVVLYMFMTADGFIAGPQGEFDSYEPSSAEEEMANDFFRGADAIMFGRVCYQGFVEYWDALDLKSPTTPPLEAEFASFFRDKPLVVVSRTLKQVVPRATLIADNVAAHVATLKQRMAGYAVLVCGPELLATLMVEGLVDELRLLTKPSVQGRGLALFRDLRQRQQLALLDTRSFASGTVLHHYRMA